MPEKISAEILRAYDVAPDCGQYHAEKQHEPGDLEYEGLNEIERPGDNVRAEDVLADVEVYRVEDRAQEEEYEKAEENEAVYDARPHVIVHGFGGEDALEREFDAFPYLVQALLLLGLAHAPQLIPPPESVKEDREQDRHEYEEQNRLDPARHVPENFAHRHGFRHVFR
jgi:hypothetical protein